MERQHDFDPPKRIYLQWHNPDHDFGVQWCPDQINDDDVEYVTAEQLETAEQRVADLERQNELLRAVAEAADSYLSGDPNNSNLTTNLQNALEKKLLAAIDGGAGRHTNTRRLV